MFSILKHSSAATSRELPSDIKITQDGVRERVPLPHETEQDDQVPATNLKVLKLFYKKPFRLIAISKLIIFSLYELFFVITWEGNLVDCMEAW